MSKQAERNTAAFQAVYDAVQAGVKLKDAIAAAGASPSGYVSSGAVKAYDIVPGGQELRDAIGDFKTEYACANEARKATFLQAHADRILAVMVELEGASA